MTNVFDKLFKRLHKMLEKSISSPDLLTPVVQHSTLNSSTEISDTLRRTKSSTLLASHSSVTSIDDLKKVRISYQINDPLYNAYTITIETIEALNKVQESLSTINLASIKPHHASTITKTQNDSHQNIMLQTNSDDNARQSFFRQLSQPIIDFCHQIKNIHTIDPIIKINFRMHIQAKLRELVSQVPKELSADLNKITHLLNPLIMKSTLSSIRTITISVHSELTKIEFLGRGNYGTVFKADVYDDQLRAKFREMRLLSANPHNFTVAYKVINQNATEENIADFKKELNICAVLWQANYLFKGRCHYNCSYPAVDSEGNEMLFTQYESGGSAYDFLRNIHAKLYPKNSIEKVNPEIVIDTCFTVLDICQDAFQGILNIHQVGVYHGDISARNVLIDQTSDGKFVADISDFGKAELKHNPNDQDEVIHLQRKTIEVQQQRMGTGLFNGQLSIATDLYGYLILILENIMHSAGFDINLSVLHYKDENWRQQFKGENRENAMIKSIYDNVVCILQGNAESNSIDSDMSKAALFMLERLRPMFSWDQIKLSQLEKQKFALFKQLVAQIKHELSVESLNAYQYLDWNSHGNQPITEDKVANASDISPSTSSLERDRSHSFNTIALQSLQLAKLTRISSRSNSDISSRSNSDISNSTVPSRTPSEIMEYNNNVREEDNNKETDSIPSSDITTLRSGRFFMPDSCNKIVVGKKDDSGYTQITYDNKSNSR